jgi:hypothetical protein
MQSWLCTRLYSCNFSMHPFSFERICFHVFFAEEFLIHKAIEPVLQLWGGVFL